MSAREVDLLIVGAGPVGLYGAYYAGVRGLSVAVVDSLSEVGGQVTAMYPEKQIYDVAGFPAISGRDLVRGLVAQAAAEGPTYLLGQEAQRLRTLGDGRLHVSTSSGTEITCGALVVTGGIGTFTPRPLPAGEDFLGRGLEYFVPSSQEYVGRDVVIVGGGDSALDWALMLEPLASSVTLVHRREAFRAHSSSVEQVRASGVRMIVNAQVTGLVGRRPPGEGRDHRQGRGARWSSRASGSSRRWGSPRTSARCATGVSSSATTGTSWSTRPCAPTCRASSRPATSRSTTARSG